MDDFEESNLTRNTQDNSDDNNKELSSSPFFSISNVNVKVEPDIQEISEIHLMDQIKSNCNHGDFKPFELQEFPFSTISNEEISAISGNTAHYNQIKAMNMKMTKSLQRQYSVLKDRTVKAILHSALQLQEEKDLCLKKETEIKQETEELADNNTNLSNNNQEKENEISKLKTEISQLQSLNELHFHNFSKVTDEKNNLQNEYDKLLETMAKNVESNMEWEMKDVQQKCRVQEKEILQKNKILKEMEVLKKKCKQQQKNIRKKNQRTKRFNKKHKKEIAMLNAELSKANTKTLNQCEEIKTIKGVLKEVYEFQEKCLGYTEIYIESNYASTARKMETMQKEYEKEISKLKDEISKLEYSHNCHLNNFSGIWLEFKELQKNYHELHETVEPKRKMPKQEQAVGKKSLDKFEQAKAKASEMEKLNSKLSKLEQIYNELQERKIQNEDLIKEMKDLKTKCQANKQTISKKSNEILQQQKAHTYEVQQLESKTDCLMLELEQNKNHMRVLDICDEVKQIVTDMDNIFPNLNNFMN